MVGDRRRESREHASQLAHWITVAGERTAQPHADVRFRRAIERRALWMAEDAARELPNLPPGGSRHQLPRAVKSQATIVTSGFSA